MKRAVLRSTLIHADETLKKRNIQFLNEIPVRLIGSKSLKFSLKVKNETEMQNVIGA